MARKILNRSELQIAAARAVANMHSFGTAEWEAAMQVVRDLVDAHQAAQPKFIYTSIDGDIFDRREVA